jgi:hypothetical protein
MCLKFETLSEVLNFVAHVSPVVIDLQVLQDRGFPNYLNNFESHDRFSRVVLVALYVEKSAIYYYTFLHKLCKIKANVSSHSLPPVYPRPWHGNYLTYIH